MSTIVRNADPDDSEFLSRCIVLAGRGHLPRGFWDVAMPDLRRQAMLVEWLVLSDIRSTCHFGNFLVAETDGRPVAALAAYDADDADMASLMPALFDAFDGYGWDPAELDDMAARLAGFATCAPPSSPGHLVIEWVACDTAHRGRGLVQRLLERAMTEGRDRGLLQAQISIVKGNQAAQAAYQRAGFRVLQERCDPVFEAAFGAAGMVTFVRGLGHRPDHPADWPAAAHRAHDMGTALP